MMVDILFFAEGTCMDVYACFFIVFQFHISIFLCYMSGFPYTTKGTLDIDSSTGCISNNLGSLCHVQLVEADYSWYWVNHS